MSNRRSIDSINETSVVQVELTFAWMAMRSIRLRLRFNISHAIKRFTWPNYLYRLVSSIDNSKLFISVSDRTRVRKANPFLSNPSSTRTHTFPSSSSFPLQILSIPPPKFEKFLPHRKSSHVYQFFLLLIFINSSSSLFSSIPPPPYFHQFLLLLIFINSSSHPNLSIPPLPYFYQFLLPPKFINSSSH